MKIWGADFTISNRPISLTRKKTIWSWSIVFKYGFVYGMDYVEDEFRINVWGEIIHVRSEYIKETF